jgi:Lar family restriction alleviation protein
MTDQPKLKHCPFCGGKSNIDNYGNNRVSTQYSCEDCGARKETGETFNHGKDWNTRTPPKVKALKWRNFEWKLVPESVSTNSVTRYAVFFRETEGLWGANYVGIDGRESKIGHKYQDCAEAKAAAQAHYNNLILSALEI